MEFWIFIVWFLSAVCKSHEADLDGETTCFEKGSAGYSLSSYATVSISCIGKDTIDASWTILNLNRIRYYQIEYQCYDSTYNQSENIIIRSFSDFGSQSPIAYHNITGLNCTITGCIEPSSRNPSIEWIQPDTCYFEAHGEQQIQSLPLLSSHSDSEPIIQSTTVHITTTAVHIESSSMSTKSSTMNDVHVTSLTTQTPPSTPVPALQYENTVILASTVAFVISLFIGFGTVISVIVIISRWKLRKRMSIYSDDPGGQGVLRSLSNENNVTTISDTISIKTIYHIPSTHQLALQEKSPSIPRSDSTLAESNTIDTTTIPDESSAQTDYITITGFQLAMNPTARTEDYDSDLCSNSSSNGSSNYNSSYLYYSELPYDEQVIYPLGSQ